jgi:prepilin peptidase CpaA
VTQVGSLVHAGAQEGCFAIAMVVAAAFDLRSRRIPNWLNLAVALSGLVAHVVSRGLTGAAWSLGGAALGLGLLYVPFAARWLGGGDVKLAGAMGAWLGPRLVLSATLYGVAVNGLLALIWMVRWAPLRREVGGNLRAALWAGELPDGVRRERGQMLPLGLALAAAAIFVMWSEGFHGQILQ